MESKNLPIAEAPIQEPTIDELIAEATKKLEQQNGDLILQIYRKEQEVKELTKALKDQEDYFNKIIAKTLIAIFGDK